MTISDLIRLAQNRLMTLNAQSTVANQRGDTEQLAKIDEEVTQTQATLDALRGLI